MFNCFGKHSSFQSSVKSNQHLLLKCFVLPCSVIGKPNLCRLFRHREARPILIMPCSYIIVSRLMPITCNCFSSRKYPNIYLHHRGTVEFPEGGRGEVQTQNSLREYGYYHTLLSVNFSFTTLH